MAAETQRYATNLYRLRNVGRPVGIVYDPETRQWAVLDLSKLRQFATKKEALAVAKRAHAGNGS